MRSIRMLLKCIIKTRQKFFLLIPGSKFLFFNNCGSNINILPYFACDQKQLILQNDPFLGWKWISSWKRGSLVSNFDVIKLILGLSPEGELNTSNVISHFSFVYQYSYSNIFESENTAFSMRTRFYSSKRGWWHPFCSYNIEFRTQHPKIDLSTKFRKFPFSGPFPPSLPGLNVIHKQIINQFRVLLIIFWLKGVWQFRQDSAIHRKKNWKSWV